MDVPALHVGHAVKNACCVWDFTWYSDLELSEMKEILIEECKKWCFQLEQNPMTGNTHYQGRVSLKIKSRSPYWPGQRIHFSATSNANKDNDFYVMKDETRLEGPWRDDDEVIYIPRDVRKMVKLLPWQEDLRRMVSIYEERVVDIVVDKVGNQGKSSISRYLAVNKLARIIPFAKDYRDIMRSVMDMPESEAYIFDLPRALSKENLIQFFSAIETIKSGSAYDDRYHFRSRFFDPPRVIVFTNAVPEKGLLSMDRWRIWSISPEGLKTEAEQVPVITSVFRQPAQPAQFVPNVSFEQLSRSMQLAPVVNSNFAGISRETLSSSNSASAPSNPKG